MKVLVVYKSGIEMVWPKDSRSKIVTPSSKPLRPGQPYPLGKEKDSTVNNFGFKSGYLKVLLSNN